MAIAQGIYKITQTEDGKHFMIGTSYVQEVAGKKDYYDVYGPCDDSNEVHLFLDAVGFIPGAGAIFDIANGIIYFVEGDLTGTSLSLIAAVPLLGDASKVASAFKSGKLVAKIQDGTDVLKITDIKDTNLQNATYTLQNGVKVKYGDILTQLASLGYGVSQSVAEGDDSLWKPTDKKADLWSKGKLKEHFDGHGSEFGAKSSTEYSDMAYKFGTRTSNSIIQVKDGAFVYRYESSTKTVFVGTDVGGKIKTFYKWDGRSDDAVINTLEGLGLIK